jgi:hypothetical protein
MINVKQQFSLILVLALGATPVLAQPEADDAAAAGSSSAAVTDKSKGSSTGTQPAPAAKESAPSSSSAGNSGRSPFDYRSSEEISEDVPVSFPVDI